MLSTANLHPYMEDRGAERGCLITAYQEEWELSGGEAVAQLLRPFQW